MGREQQNICFKIQLWFGGNTVSMSWISGLPRGFCGVKSHAPRNSGGRGECPLESLQLCFLWGFGCWKLLLKEVFDNKHPFLGSDERISVKRNRFNDFLETTLQCCSWGGHSQPNMALIKKETHCQHQGKAPCPFCLTQSLTFKLCCQQKVTRKRVGKEINQQLLLSYGCAGCDGVMMAASWRQILGCPVIHWSYSLSQFSEID